MSNRSKRIAPTLKQLELLLTLAASDGIASAGAKLGMTPSATSHALRALEEILGTTLVEKTQQGLALTYPGEQVLPHVRDVFTSLQLVEATARSGAELKTGLLKLGSFGASASLHALPPVLKQFRAKYPGVKVLVKERPDDETTQDIIERRVEIAAVTLPKRDFETVPLAIDELVAVLPERHELARQNTVDLSEIVRYPFIMTLAGSQKLILRLFARYDYQPDIHHELLQLMSILELVSRGEGVSILARLALPKAYPGVAFVPLTPSTRRSIGLACLNENKLSPVARAFWLEAKRSKELLLGN